MSDAALVAGKRLPSLDGLRAASILLVFTSHLYWSKTLPILDPLWRFQLGDLGVRVFFVISGFLITHLLLHELESKGSISLKAFYVRRILRIFPAYYAFLIFVFLASRWGYLQTGAGELATAALYVSNYFARPAALAHTWSLSVEEQFYILWPGVMILLGVSRSIVLACAFAVIGAGIRAWGSFPLSPQTNVFWVTFATAGDAIAIGCVFAAIRGRLWQFPVYRLFCSPMGTLLSAIAIGFLATSHRWPWFWNSVGITSMNICIVLVLDGCMRARGHWYYSVLNSPPVVYIGVLSYSLYLWQQLFLTGVWKVAFPLNLALTVLAAMLSFYLIEQPVARLKQAYWPATPRP